jgi:hypothetical protein
VYDVPLVVGAVLTVLSDIVGSGAWQG